jgi:DNA-dependent RNA polymerase auxiliary subunit epsilon
LCQKNSPQKIENEIETRKNFNTKKNVITLKKKTSHSQFFLQKLKIQRKKFKIKFVEKLNDKNLNFWEKLKKPKKFIYNEKLILYLTFFNN